jgi:hypothetical protein
MQKVLIWLAGADWDILSRCTKNKQSQQIKYAGFGALVLIPALVGLCSMMYAISTLTTSPSLIITGGLVWTFIVITIDRFIIATFHKSRVESTTFSHIISIILRYVFAVFIGVAVSHPVALLWFRESISNKIDDQRRLAVTARKNQAITQTSQVPHGSSFEQVNSKTDRRDCLVNLLTLEQSGVQEVTKCGASSGIPECGKRCDNIKAEIAQLNKEIQVWTNQASAETKQELDDKTDIQRRTAKDVEEIEKTFPKDYLARVDALAEIERGRPHVTQVKWFLLMFFIFVDILPITMKMITPMGEYELIRDTLLFEVRSTQEAEQKAIRIHAESTLPAVLRAKLNYDSKEEEITHLTNVTQQFINRQESIRSSFDEQFKEAFRRIKKIQDGQLKTYYENYLSKMRQTFNVAWSKAYSRFQDFISAL